MTQAHNFIGKKSDETAVPTTCAELWYDAALLQVL